MMLLTAAPIALYLSCGAAQDSASTTAIDERMMASGSMQYTVSGMCGFRKIVVSRTDDPNSLEVFSDGKKQTISNSSDVSSMLNRPGAGVFQILCGRPTFRLAIGNSSNLIGYAYGHLRD
jgi:hypothetical protein